MWAKLLTNLRQSRIWRSVFRTPLPTDLRGRALVVMHNFFLHLHPAKIARSALKMRSTFCLGGVTAFLFFLLTVTGVFLMFYYVPDVRRAYPDMKDIMYVVPFGRVLRAAHRWAAHLMVVTVILHMARVFLAGAYRPPREFNWVVGVSLLVLTLLLSFTGYLLPWDQLAYWAITVGTNMAAAIPVLGHDGPFRELLASAGEVDVRYLLLGDSEVGQNALLRFYVLHCVGLPILALVLMGVHFWRVRRDGGIARPL